MSTEQVIVYIIAPLVAYFLGAIPFGFVIGKAHGVDIRKVGSGNIGATNLGRTLGMKYFWQAMILDALKGFLPVFLTCLFVAHVNQHGYSVDPSQPSIFSLGPVTLRPTLYVVKVFLPSWSPLIAGVAAMLGHVFPIYLKFRGGKGVATSFGVVLGLWPVYTIAGLLAGLTFVVVFMGCRYISLSSILSSIAFMLYVIFLVTCDLPPIGHIALSQRYPLVGIAVAFAALIIIKHRSNIARLLKGTEPKWGQKH